MSMPVANHMTNEVFCVVILQRGVWCLLRCSRGFGAMSAGGWPLIFHALVSVFPMRRPKEQFASLALIGSPYVCDIYIDLSVIFISWLANRPVGV